MSNHIYGIDLGTTNSIIGLHEHLCSGLVKSIANLKDKTAGNNLKTNFSETVIRSFKKDMSMSGSVPIKASSYVLQELVNQVKQNEGDDVKRVVITVPAYFTDNNRQATREAAEMIGLEVVRIINEPTAAAIYYNRDKKAKTLVYDLGGGTFDISLIDNKMGVYRTVTTDGNKLGGDNLDEALVKFILNKAGIPEHRIDKMDDTKLKVECERAKLTIQSTGLPTKVSLKDISYATSLSSIELTLEEYESVMKEVFRPTLKKTLNIIEKYLDSEQFKFLFVGGSTRDPYLRKWIEEEAYVKSEKFDYDPDMLVAQGAAYFAMLVEQGKIEGFVEDIVSSPIGIAMEDGTVRQLIRKDSILPVSQSRPFINPGDTDKLMLDVHQGDSLFANDTEFLGRLEFNYGKVVPKGEGVVKVTLSVDVDGLISIKARSGRGKVQTLVLDRGAYK